MLPGRPIREVGGDGDTDFSKMKQGGRWVAARHLGCNLRRIFDAILFCVENSTQLSYTAGKTKFSRKFAVNLRRNLDAKLISF